MKQLGTVLGALLLGAGAMYYFDPDHGRRRRALAADRFDSVSHDARDYLQGKRKRTADRMRGMLATMRGRMNAAAPGDEQLNAQIRSRLGRVVSFPHAVETHVMQGRVQLRGDILADEFNPLMAEIWTLRGVTAIDSQLALHTEPGGVPALQGKPRRLARGRMRKLKRSAAALALTAGVGAGLGALRVAGSGRAGLLSLAMGLLAWSFKGSGPMPWRRAGAQRGKAETAEFGTAHPPETAVGSAAMEPAPNPPSSAWH